MKKINYDVALQMRNEGITYAAIAEMFGVSKQAVQQLLSRSKFDPNDMHSRHRKELFERCVFPGLASAIKERFPSISDFSRASGIPYTTLYYIFIGNVEPRTSTINALCQYLGKTYEELFTKEVNV